jgi:hypothetical protein
MIQAQVTSIFWQHDIEHNGTRHTDMTALSITTLSIMTVSTITLSIMTFNLMTLSMLTLVSLWVSFYRVSGCHDIQNSNNLTRETQFNGPISNIRQTLFTVTLTAFMLCFFMSECHFNEWQYVIYHYTKRYLWVCWHHLQHNMFIITQ